MRMGESTRCARVLVEELITRGVTEVVLAPGSRSAPLAYEVLEADRIGLLRLHVRVDERTAGFLALGLAKRSGAPVAVITTSGTATANLHPAVLEAWHSAIPLVVITASRPRAVIHAGANQTTDQEQLFGRHVRGYAGIGDRDGHPWSWRFELARLLVAATGSRGTTPGPVQLNVEIGEEVAPAGDEEPLGLAALDIADRSPSAEPFALGAGPQTVVVAGDAPPAVGRSWAARAASAAIPLLAEPSSNARRGPAALGTGRLLAASTLADAIERVVVVGHPTLSRPINRLLARRDVELIVVSDRPEWIDPGLAVSRVVDAVTFPEGDPEWLATWTRADALLRTRLEAMLADASVVTGPVLAAALWASLDGGDTLFVGSSNPIRDLDLAPISAAPPDVYANRGLAGIDGSVSTATGIALATGRPTHALLGDVTTVHDLTGLVIGPDEPHPDLRIVVASDDGGSIFATLEHGEPARQRSFERLFGTPHRVDFSALAAATGVRYRRVEDTGELAQALAEPPVGVELTEVVVDRAGRRRLHLGIAALVTELEATL